MRMFPIKLFTLYFFSLAFTFLLVLYRRTSKTKHAFTITNATVKDINLGIVFIPKL